MFNLYGIENTQAISMTLPDMSSLDAITRQLPSGYYSTFRTYDGCRRVLGLKSHLRRLYDPMSAPEVIPTALRRQLRALLEPFRPNEARVRVVMTKQGQVYVALEPLKPLPPEVYRNGVRVETTEIQRHHPRLKSTAFIERSESTKKHIAQEGIFEALLVKNRRILEGMTSNFFYVLRAERSDERSPRSVDETPDVWHDRASSAEPQSAFGSSTHYSPEALRERQNLSTARRDILLGVTRRTIIHLARKGRLKVKYHALKLNQLSDVNEAFITSSSRGVVPVVQIDDVVVGQGRVGHITEVLMSAYEEYVLNHAEKI